jgi:hypothetical protein
MPTAKPRDRRVMLARVALATELPLPKQIRFPGRAGRTRTAVSELRLRPGGASVSGLRRGSVGGHE